MYIDNYILRKGKKITGIFLKFTPCREMKFKGVKWPLETENKSVIFYGNREMIAHKNVCF